MGKCSILERVMKLKPDKSRLLYDVLQREGLYLWDKTDGSLILKFNANTA